MPDIAHIEHFLAARAASGGDDIAAIRTVRVRFGLDLAAAKEVMLVATGYASTLDEHQQALMPSVLEVLDEFESALQPENAGAPAPGGAEIRSFYARLLRRVGSETHTETEIGELRALLMAAAGVVRLKTIEGDPKGGYRVTLDLEWSRLEDFVRAVEAAGWMNCL